MMNSTENTLNTRNTISTPYTLEKLMNHVNALHDAPFQRFLKAKLHELWLLKADDQHLAHRINLIRQEMMEPAILEGIAWKDVIRYVAWTKPYYLWIKCLAAGQNSSECLLPAHFLNWRDSIVENDIRKYSR